MSESNYHVTFLRHGESVGNQENRFQGQADFPLTDKGRAQARALAETTIFTSVALGSTLRAASRAILRRCTLSATHA